MKKILYLLVGIVLFGGLYYSCAPEELPGSIYGTVVDKATGEPIKSAGVELSPSGLKTVTGSEGQFEFTELDPGKYTLIITKTGYVDGVSGTIEVKPGQQAKGDVQIEKLPPALKVVDDNRQEISTLDFGSAIDDVARSFSLFNDGTESLEWQITVTADWIKSVSKIEGVLSAGATQSLIVTIDRTKLKSGENTTTAHITSNNGSKQLTITATNSTVLATLNTLAATNIKTTTATLNGEILTDGSPKYSERGFVYSESSMPTLGSCIQKITSTLTDSKTYSATVSGLTKGKTYYVRAYAINAGKEAYSTNEVSFTPTSVLAEVATQSVSNISKSNGTATFSGTIISEGDPVYTERGFVYGTANNPSVDSDTKLVVSGKGLGNFSTNASGLKVGNIYYVRAYATNEQGTAYGKEEQADFTPAAPSVSTISVSNISRSAGTAKVTGKILNAGDPAYTARGFVYSTSSNPTLGNGTKVVVSGSGTGEYSTTISSLQVGKIYYVRAFVTNAKGTFYGADIKADFTPIPPQVSTVSVEYKSSTSAYFIGKITNVGDPEYTERGFIYAKIQNPTLDDASVVKVIVSKTSSSQFEKQVTNANWGNHLWYIRAYAISSAGVSYGEIKTIQDPEYAEYLKLPTFDFAGYLYHVYPDMGEMTWSQAMSACNGLSYGGYDDWYLPNNEELNAMYQKRSSIGGFSATCYWSSTEYSSSSAWYQRFDVGYSSSYCTKSIYHRVRCVRREE